MKTAQQIFNSYESSHNYISHTCRLDLFAAMKEIAEQAFDAGFNYSGECLIDHIVEISKPSPNKEQFIKSIFKQ